MQVDPSLHVYEITARSLDGLGVRCVVFEAFSAADALVLYGVEHTDPAWCITRMRCVGSHERLTEEQSRQLWERSTDARARVAQGSGR